MQQAAGEVLAQLDRPFHPLGQRVLGLGLAGELRLVVALELGQGLGRAAGLVRLAVGRRLGLVRSVDYYLGS